MLLKFDMLSALESIKGFFGLFSSKSRLASEFFFPERFKIYIFAWEALSFSKGVSSKEEIDCEKSSKSSSLLSF